MKKVTCIIALLAILMSLVSGCSGKEKHPSNYDQLTALMGQSREAVCTQLGLTEDDLEEDPKIPGECKTPVQIEYAGVDFDLVLIFDILEDLFIGFRYRATYEAAPETAAKDTVTVAKHLSKTMGKPYYTKKDILISDQTQADLQAIFSDSDSDFFSSTNHWDLTEGAGSEIKEHMEHVRNTEHWLKYFGADTPAYFFMDFLISHDPDTDQSHIQVSYCIDHPRGSVNYGES